MGEVIRPPQWDDRATTRFAAWKIANRRAMDAGEQVLSREAFERAYEELKQHLRREREKKARGLGNILSISPGK
jgi:hypothetical protein